MASSAHTACVVLIIGGSWLLWLVGLFSTICARGRGAARAPEDEGHVSAPGRRATAE